MNIVQWMADWTVCREAITRFEMRGRAQHLDVLSTLFGEQHLEMHVSELARPLCHWIEYAFPDIYKSLARPNPMRVQEVVSAIILHAAFNAAQVLYPNKVQNVMDGGFLDPGEVISLHQFLTDIFVYLFKAIKDNIVLVDDLVAQGHPLNDELFVPASQKMMEFFFPKKTAGFIAEKEASFYSYLLSAPLLSLFKSLYKTFLLDPQVQVQGPGPGPGFGAFPIQPFVPLIEKGFAILIEGIADDVIRDENNEPLRGWLEQNSAPLIHLFRPELQRVLPYLAHLPEPALQKALVAILLKLFSNLERSRIGVDKPGHNIPLNGLLHIRRLVFRHFQLMSARRARGKEVRPEHFLPMANELLGSLFQHDHDSLRVLCRRMPSILNLVTNGLLLFETRSQLNLDLEPNREKFRKIMWDKEKFQKLVRDGLILPTEPTKDLSILFKIEDLIVQIERLSQHLGFELTKQIRILLEDEKTYEAFSEAIGLGKKNGWIHLIKNLLSIPDLTNDRLFYYISLQLSGILFSVITRAIERGSATVGKERAVYHFIEGLIAVFATNFPKKVGKARHYHALSNALIRYLFETGNPKLLLEDYLPIPRVLAIWVAGKIRNEWLPTALDYFISAYHREMKDLPQEDPLLGQFSHLIGQYVREFLPYLLERNGGQFAGDIVHAAENFLIKSPQEFAEDRHFRGKGMDKPHEMLVLWTRNVLFCLARSPLPPSLELFGLIGNYSEALLKRFLDHFARHIHAIELDRAKKTQKGGEEAPQLDAVKGILEVSHAHMQRVNLVTGKLRVKDSLEVPKGVMVDHFQMNDELHPLMNSDAPANGVIYLKELTRKLSNLVNMRLESLPAPPLLQPVTFELLQTILPTIAQELLELMHSPMAVQNYLLALLISIQKPLAKEEGKGVVYEGALQKEIENVCGELLQELIGLHPTLAKPLLRYRGIKGSAGKAVGQALRHALETNSLTDLVNLLIRNSLTSIHHGIWVTEEAYKVWSQTGLMPKESPEGIGARFFPLRKNRDAEWEHGWDFNLPRTEKKQKEVEEVDRRQSLQKKKQVIRELANTIANQAELSLHAAGIGIWRDFQEAIDSALAECLGEESTQLKKQLDTLFNLLWKYFFKPFLTIILFPPKKVGKALVYYHFLSQAKARVNEISNPIHQNLLLRCFDKIVDFLHHPVPQNI